MDDDATEIESLRESLKRSSERIAELSADLHSVREELARRGAENDHLRAAVNEAEVERLRMRVRILEVRLSRVHALAPVRLYNRMRGLPPVSWIVARRTRAYQAELEMREGD